jgi:hypothetical protein
VSFFQTYGHSVYWIADAWAVIYWTTYVLTWLVLPIIYGYIDSGHSTFKTRLIQAVKEQVRWRTHDCPWSYYDIYHTQILILIIYVSPDTNI